MVASSCPYWFCYVFVRDQRRIYMPLFHQPFLFFPSANITGDNRKVSSSLNSIKRFLIGYQFKIKNKSYNLKFLFV